MTRSTVLVVSCVLALAASACGDAAAPDLGYRAVFDTPQDVSLIGIVEATADTAPRLGLRRGDVLTFLAGNIADLDAHLGATVKVTGAFADNGDFVVSTYSVEAPPEAAMNRVAP